MYAWPQYGGACIVQRAVGAECTDIPCAGSALAVLACRISVIIPHQSLLWATTEDSCMMDRQLYLFYHQLLTIRCVLQEYLNRRQLYLIPLCKAACIPGEAGVSSRGKPLPHPYRPEIGSDFTYFTVKKVRYLSTKNEFDTNRQSILKNIEIKNTSDVGGRVGLAISGLHV